MTVYLVGAGPGDPELMTVKAMRVLARADVIVHDWLADSSIVELAPPDAQIIDVGKQPGSTVQQEEINALLIELATTKKTVVRLKGGDPFVFGRGGEEALALQNANIPFEVVPGVTSAIAVPAIAGIPVTHRGVSGAFTVVTGHREHGGSASVNWEALAQVGGTLVILMGVNERAKIAQRLISGGLAPDTPAAAIRWGTRPDQVEFRGILTELETMQIDSPAVIIIGAVAAMDLRSAESVVDLQGLTDDIQVGHFFQLPADEHDAG